jgi:hypothetical protein
VSALLLGAIAIASLGSARPAGASNQPIYTLPFFSSYTITCPWGPYSNCGLTGWHSGTDYSLGGNTAPGESVVAALGGTTQLFEDFNPQTGLGCGHYLVIDHTGGHKSRYCHLLDRVVASGQVVTRGQLIGHEGSSGADGVHLHFDTREGTTPGDCCSGTSVDPYAGPYSPGTYLWTTNPPSYPPPDSDGDGVPDASDNCPNWPNPTQGLPPWPVPSGDPDCDGFDTSDEGFMGTDAARYCAATLTPNDEAVDAWPVDNNDDRQPGLADILAYIPVFLTSAPGPPYLRRLDLNANNTIGLADILAFIPFYLGTCTP